LHTHVNAFAYHLPLAGQINFMRRQLSFFLLLSSWICSVFLICLFPPVSDFSQTDLESGSISQEPSPELTLKNSSRSRSSFQIGILLDLEFVSSESLLAKFNRVEILMERVQSVKEFTSSYCSKRFFRLFFETF
jgi:hypothetical protein